MVQLFRKPYVYWVVGILFLYLILSVLISGFYNTIPLIILYATTLNWVKLGFSLILTLIIGFFVSINSVLFYLKYKERKKCRGAGVAGVGTAGGLIVGICPLCVTGVFPLILSFVGISFSFASLPFQGIEVQLAVLILLILGYYKLK